jgi:hypothetical protein
LIIILADVKISTNLDIVRLEILAFSFTIEGIIKAVMNLIESEIKKIKPRRRGEKEELQNYKMEKIWNPKITLQILKS